MIIRYGEERRCALLINFILLRALKRTMAIRDHLWQYSDFFFSLSVHTFSETAVSRDTKENTQTCDKYSMQAYMIKLALNYLDYFTIHVTHIDTIHVAHIDTSITALIFNINIMLRRIL